MAKVLLVTNNFPPVRGGSASVYANLARCAEGQVIVLAARNDYSDGLPLIGWREHDRHAGYQVRRLPLLRTVLGRANESRGANTARRLRDIVIRVRLAATLLGTILFQGVRVVCVGELLTGSWIVDFVRILPGVRTVAYVHGEEITTSDSYDTTHSRARHALGASDHIITVSRFTYDAVAALIGPESAGNRIHLIHNGVDTAHFHPRSRPIDLTHLYGLDGCFVFVSVSRLVEKKGTDNTIRAFARMAPDFPDCRLLIVGAGPYRPRLEEIRAEMGVADKVVFTGAVAETELADHYQLGDVFIMPNRKLENGDTEGFGVVFLEANSCGLPAIAGRDGGSIEAVQDGINGLVVDGNDVGQITAAMVLLRKDRPLYETLQRQGLDRAARSDWHIKTRNFLEVCAAR